MQFHCRAAVTIVLKFDLDPLDFDEYEGDPDDMDKFHDFIQHKLLQDDGELDSLMSQHGYAIDTSDLKTETIPGEVAYGSKDT